LRALATPNDDPGRRLARSVGAFQNAVQRAGPAASAGYTLIGALLFLGGIGYALDHWLGTAPWCLVGGLLAGIVVGFYELAKTVFSK
jgi:F0F1-type ATP synthase assembly protein I